MKKIMIFMILFFFAGCVSMYTKATVEQKMNEKVYEAPDVDKAELYRRALEWTVRYYAAKEWQVNLRDPKKGKIILFAVADTNSVDGRVKYRFEFDAKDNKFRIKTEMLSQTGSAPVDYQTKGYCTSMGGSIDSSGYCEYAVLETSLDKFKNEIEKVYKNASSAILEKPDDDF